MELADTPDLGSGAVRFGGSSPPSRIPLFIQGIAVALLACLSTACSRGSSDPNSNIALIEAFILSELEHQSIVAR